jgi:hypothetical protein
VTGRHRRMDLPGAEPRPWLHGDLGRLAYEAYAEAVGWKTYEGRPLLSWADLPVGVQRGWRASANAVIEGGGI